MYIHYTNFQSKVLDLFGCWYFVIFVLMHWQSMQSGDGRFQLLASTLWKVLRPVTRCHLCTVTVRQRPMTFHFMRFIPGPTSASARRGTGKISTAT